MDSGVIRKVLFLSITALHFFSGAAKADSLERLEAIASRASSLSAFLNDRILLAQYRTALTAYFGKSRHDCESFDDLIKKIRSVNQRLPAFGVSLWTPVGARSLTVLGGKVREERFVLRGVSRRFHALWLERSENQCPAVECRESDRYIPERWVAGLEGSQVYFLEKNHRFAGASILKVAAKHGQEAVDLVYAFGSLQLESERILWQGFPEKRGSGSLLSHWLTSELPFASQELTIVRPGNTLSGSPIVVKVKDWLLKTKREMGAVAEFSPRDEAAPALAKVAPRRCAVAEATSKDLLFGMTAPVQSVATNASFAPALESVNPLLFVVSDLPGAQEKKMLQTLPPEQIRKIQLQWMDTLKNNPRPDQRARAAMGLGTLGMLKNAVELPAYEASLSRLPRFLDFSDSGARGSLEQALSDPSPSVRGAAALGLAENGIHSTLGTANLSAAVGGGAPSRAPAALPDGFLPRAADQLLKDKPSRDKARSFGDLANRLGDIKDPKARQALEDRLSKEWFRDRDGSLLGELGRLSQTNPDAVDRLADALRESDSDKKKCDQEDEIKRMKDEASQEDRAQRGGTR